MWVIKILNTYYKANRTNISTEDNRRWKHTFRCSDLLLTKIQRQCNTCKKKKMKYRNVFIFLVGFGFKAGKCVGY